MIPKLRFPGFSEEWETKKLGDVANLTSSKRVYLSDYVYSGIPFYRGKEITELKKNIIPDDILYITKDAYERFRSKFGAPQKNEILITAVGTLGNILRVKDDEPFYFKDGNLIWLRDITEDPYFLEIILEKSKPELLKSAIGSSQQALTIAGLGKVKIRLPKQDEQEKIAGFLTVVDERIAAMDRKVELLQQYKKGVIQKIFTQQLRFKDENGKDYPAWQTKKLGEVFDGAKGSGLSWNNVSHDGKNKCILYGELYTKYPERISVVLSRTNINEGVTSKKNDLLLPCSTTTTGIDLANATALDEGGILLGGDISILRFKGGGSNTFYAYYLSHFMKNKLAAYGQGSTIVHMYYSHYKNMQIIEPSTKEQQKIADFLTNLDDKINLEKTKLEQAKQFKKSLLQRMFA